MLMEVVGRCLFRCGEEVTGLALFLDFAGFGSNQTSGEQVNNGVGGRTMGIVGNCRIKR